MPEIGIKLYNNRIKPIGRTDSPDNLETIVTTITDDQDVAEVEFFLIGDPPGKKIEPLGMLTVSHIPPAKAGEPKIIVQVGVSNGRELDLKLRMNDTVTEQVVVPGGGEKSPAQAQPRRVEPGKGYEEVKLAFAKESPPLKSSPPEKKPGTRIDVAPGGVEEVRPLSRGRGKSLLLVLLVCLLLGGGFWGLNRFVFPGFLAGGEKPPLVGKGKGTAAPLTPIPAAYLGGLPVETPAPTQTTRPIPGTQISKTAVPVMVPSPVSEPLQAIVTPLAAVSTPAGLPLIDIPALEALLAEDMPLYFYPDSAELLPASLPDLKNLLNRLGAVRNRVKLRITGHAAAYDSAESQLDVSRERAMYVSDQLTGRGGWDPALISLDWKGANEPVYSGMDVDRQQLNRRVELRLLGAVDD